MENIEFIAANNLPITEAEEVDVLCVVDGELKRKPAEGLGGAGNYVLVLTADNAEVTESGNNLMINYLGSYDDFAEHLYNGGTMVADVSALYDSPAAFLITAFVFESETLILLGGIGSMMVLSISCSNGTLTSPLTETTIE